MTPIVQTVAIVGNSLTVLTKVYVSMCIHVCVSMYVHVCVCVCMPVGVCTGMLCACAGMCAHWWLPSNQSFYRQFGGYMKGVGH